MAEATPDLSSVTKEALVGESELTGSKANEPPSSSATASSNTTASSFRIRDAAHLINQPSPAFQGV